MGSSSDSQQLQQPDITSQTHPILVLPIYLSVGTVYVTMPPGFQGMLYRKARGVAAVRRDLSADVARLALAGLPLTRITPCSSTLYSQTAMKWKSEFIGRAPKCAARPP